MNDPFAGLQSISANGVSLAYRERGQGAPVVFIHGSASDLRTWEDQLPAIGASYRAIAYSRRYARPNGDIADGVDDQMLPHVDDLVGFLSAIEIPAAVVIKACEMPLASSPGSPTPTLVITANT